MWGNRELVLALAVVAALHGTLNGEKKQAKELDMAMDSVDDRYDGCRDETLKGLPARLKAELAASSDFEVAWKASSSAYAVVPGGRPEHGQALQAYAFEGNSGFRNKFNNAVATMGGNQSFPFYSLHFLLTDAITLLSGKGDACRTVYSVSKQLYSAQKGAKVKLGTFTSASASASSLVEDPDVEGGVLFNITSCLAVNLEIKWGEMETLLLPTEEYTVEDIQKIDSEDGYSYTIITLKHAGFSSKNNCYLTPRPQKGSSTQVVGCIWAVYLAVAVFGLLN